MSAVIPDCSFTSSLFLPDEKSNAVQKYILKHSDTYEFIVPVLWWYETANVLTMAKRRNRIGQIEIDTIFELLERLNLITDTSHHSDFTKKILSITQDHPISSYDAVYLEAAIRYNCALATLDKNLFKIAVKSGIDVVKL